MPIDASFVNDVLSSGDTLGINLRMDPLPPGEFYQLDFAASATLDLVIA